MLVLGIETSCDDTAVALYSDEKGLVAQHIYHQTELHNAFGGVVPELASRDHAAHIVPLLRHLLTHANCALSDITAIAYTSGPGLIGPLLAGATVGRSLAYALNIPAIGVHHLEGHLLASMLEAEQPAFPFLTLLVSGGHTLLIAARALGDYEILGESLDDAAGEAFDKTAKLLGLGYPGGAALAALAEQGHDGAFHFTRPMTDRPGLDFSFSGLKTQVLTAWQHSDQTAQTKADIAHAFEQAVVDTLMIKCKRALIDTGFTQLVVGGGVAANGRLREQLTVLMREQQGQVFYSRPAFCTDNAAMIAYAGCQRLQIKQAADLAIFVRPRWSIMDIIR